MIALFVCVLLFSCSNSDNDSGGEYSYVDLTSPDSLLGKYTIDFFEAVTPNGIISNNCQVSSEPANCQTVYLISGIGIITKDNSSSYVLKTKIQAFNSLMINTAAAEVYQYTEYTPIPAANITTDGINIKDGVKGIKGRNLLYTTDNPDSTFYMTYDNRTKLLTNNLSIIKKVTAHFNERGVVSSCSTIENLPVVVKLRKLEDTVSILSGDELLIPNSSINDNGNIFYPYEKFTSTAGSLICP